MRGKFFSLVIVILLCTLGVSSFAMDLKITSVRPRGGSFGDVVVLGGTFGKETGKVFFGNVPAEVMSWSESSIKVVVPLGVKEENLKVFKKGRSSKKLVPIKVISSLGKSNEIGFDILPLVSKISPSVGGVYNHIKIYGKNFSPYIDIGKVYVGGTSANVVRWSKKEIEVEVPFISKDNIEKIPVGKKKFRYGTYVYVMVDGLKSNEKPLWWMPEAHSLVPSSSGAGDLVCIEGNHFGQCDKVVNVFVGGVKAKVKKVEDRKITFVVPDLLKNVDKWGRAKVLVCVCSVETSPLSIKVLPRIDRVSYLKKEKRFVVKGRNFGKNKGKLIILTKEGDKVLPKILSWGPEEIIFSIPTKGCANFSLQVKATGVLSNKVMFRAR